MRICPLIRYHFGRFSFELISLWLPRFLSIYCCQHYYHNAFCLWCWYYSCFADGILVIFHYTFSLLFDSYLKYISSRNATFPLHISRIFRWEFLKIDSYFHWHAAYFDYLFSLIFSAEFTSHCLCRPILYPPTLSRAYHAFHFGSISAAFFPASKFTTTYKACRLLAWLPQSRFESLSFGFGCLFAILMPQMLQLEFAYSARFYICFSSIFH